MVIIGAVDNVDNWLVTDGNCGKITVESLVDHSGVEGSRTRSFPRASVGVFWVLLRSVDERTQVIPDVLRVVCTRFPQVLHIQSLPYFCDLLAYSEVELDRFFDLFNRMNRGGVVFTSKFVGDLRET